MTITELGADASADMPLLALYRRDMERRGLRPRSIHRLLDDLKHFSRTHDGGFAAASRESVEEWLDRRRYKGRPICSRTRFKWLSTLHSLYSWAVELGHLPSDPTRFIARPKMRRNLPRPMPEEDLRRALEDAAPLMRCFLLLGALAGLRCQEIAGLDAEDVLEHQGLLRVVHGKGGHERLVPLHPSVLAALRQYGIPQTGPMFRSPRDLARFSPSALSQRINNYLRSLGIDATAHTLRHRFGTDVQMATGDLRVTQELLGHQSPTTTAIYAAFSQVRAREAVLSLSVPDPCEADILPLQRQAN